MCKAYYTAMISFWPAALGLSQAYNARIVQLFPLTAQLGGPDYGINTFTHMPAPAPSSSKRQALQASGTFNSRHARVRHRLFQDSEFFDPRDLLQLKYESLRALQQEDYSLAQAASEFGLSRPTLYQAQAHFQAQGLEGLLPGKRGPKGAHKLRPELLEQLRQWLAAEPALSVRQLAQRVRQRFKLKVHPRTLEKALKPKAKRGRLKS
jgi:transposase